MCKDLYDEKFLTLNACSTEANARAWSVSAADSATTRARLSRRHVPRDTTVHQGLPLLWPVLRSVSGCESDLLLLVFCTRHFLCSSFDQSRAPTPTSLVVVLQSTAGRARLDTTAAEPVCPTPRASVTQDTTAHLEPPPLLRLVFYFLKINPNHAT